ncbi:MAG TPA: SGNH/GDSL hydrolase family protein [Candidatus Limnocylindrales bacterium]|nr:SGNH/GDSL hydrolase family protein [Candidatus Limnocylindrales bacterium]
MKTSQILKDLLAKVSLALMSLIIFFIVLELGFRGIEGLSNWMHKSSKPWAIYDEDLLYRPRPDYEDLNSDGLRNRPIDPVKTKFRLLILGDSIPFYGDNPEDTYVGRLETNLHKDPDLVPIETINAGIKGYTNYQELVYLKKYGLKFNPDLIGVSFCLNDLHKFLHQFKVENGEIVSDTYEFTEEAVHSVDSTAYQLARKSHFLVWLRHKLSIFESLIELKTQEGFTFDYRPDFRTAWKDESWPPIENQLKEMVELGKTHGFRVFLVVFPFGEQLREDYLARDRAYVTKPQQKLKAICERLGIPMLDLFPDIDRKKHLLEDQIHLTREGRELVAEKIALFLKREQLVPTRSMISQQK